MDYQKIVSNIDKEASRLRSLPQPNLTNEKPILHKKVNVKKLLKLDTPQFVENLYLEIMGRPGDKDGIAHFNNMLNTGAISRENLIVEIRKSPEGMDFGAHLQGLPIRYMREALRWRKTEIYNRLREIKHIIMMR